MCMCGSITFFFLCMCVAVIMFFLFLFFVVKLIIIFNFLQLEVELNVAGNLEFEAIYNSTLYVSGFFLLSVTSR